MTASKSSSVIFSRDLSRRMPALVTRMSSPPKVSTALSTSCWAVSEEPTGATTAAALPPASVMEATAASAASWLTSLMITAAP